MGGSEPIAECEVDGARAALRQAVRVAAGQGAVQRIETSPPAFRAIETSEVYRELSSLLMGARAGDGLEQLLECGAVHALLPELVAMVGLHEEPPDGSAGRARHKDVWAHTKKVVDQSVRVPAIRWAALLHDVGKPETRSVNDRGEIHFLGHAEVGAGITRRMTRRLGMPVDVAKRVRFLVKHHLRANQYDPSWTDSAVRRFAREMDDGLEDLLALSRADITTQRPARREQGLRSLDELARRIREIREADSKPIPLPKGLGTAIILTFRFVPGPVIGRVRHAIEEAAERGEIPMQADYETYLSWARANLRDEIVAGGGDPDAPSVVPPPEPDEGQPIP